MPVRNARRGERDVALRRAARCSTAVCLLLAAAHRSRCATRRSATTEAAAARIGDTGFAPTFRQLRPAATPEISARRSRRCARGGCRCSLLLTLDTCRVVVFLACGSNRTPTGLLLLIPSMLEVGGRCRDGCRGRCARQKVDGEGEEEARASPSRRSVK